MEVRQRLKSIVRRGLVRHGVTVGVAPRVESLDQHLRVMIEAMQVSHVVDVGASTGGYGLRLRRNVGYTGPIRSYEPEAESFRQLAARAAGDDLWSVRKVALGRTRGTASLNVFPGHEDFNSLHTPTTFGAAHFPLKEMRAEQVPVERLDDVLQQELPGARFMLKIDTQGHDLEVLAGADEVLRRTVVLQVEAPLRNVYEQAPKLAEYLDFFEQNDFLPTGMFTAARGPQAELVEVDLIGRRTPQA